MDCRKRLGAVGMVACSPSPIASPLPFLAVWLVALVGNLLWVSLGRAEESVAQRRQRLEQMDSAQKAELLQQKKQFDALKPEERERIRQLHEQLENDPSGDDLRRVMHAYADWLRSLSTFERDELADLAPADRIKEIQQLRFAQARQPTREDLEGLERWIRQYSADPENQAKLLSVPDRGRRGFSPTEGRRDSLSSPPNAWLTEQIVREQLQLSRSSRPPQWYGFQIDWPDRPVWPTDDELADLRSCLSERTAKRLEPMPADEQLRVISDWMRNSWDHRFSGSRLRVSSPPPEDLLERLDAYFQELPDEDKDRLLRLPHEDMRGQLEAMYLGQFWSMPGIEGRGFGRRDGSPMGHDGRDGGRSDGRDGGRYDVPGGVFDVPGGGWLPEGPNGGRGDTGRPSTEFGPRR
jgi:hypothetical protein